MRTCLHCSLSGLQYVLPLGRCHFLWFIMEAVLPTELEIPSLWILMEVELEEAEWTRSYFDQLNFLEEKRDNDFMSRSMLPEAYNLSWWRKGQTHSFQRGDLVLKKILPFKEDLCGKFRPNKKILPFKEDICGKFRPNLRALTLYQKFCQAALCIRLVWMRIHPTLLYSDSVKMYLVECPISFSFWCEDMRFSLSYIILSFTTLFSL